MKLMDLNYADIKDYMEAKSNSLIIPVGTCEQHGNHLPIGTDTKVAEYMADILSAETGILIAPTVNYGVNLPCDRLMNGTTSITEETLHDTLYSIINWWQAQGFNTFIIITCHGDPFHVRALSNLGPNILCLEPEGEIDYSDILESQDCIRHACEAETSIALYLFPELVKMEKIKECDIEYSDFEPYLFHKIEAQPTGYVGNLGYPSFASKEKGETILTRMKDYMLNEYGEFIRKYV